MDQDTTLKVGDIVTLKPKDEEQIRRYCVDYIKEWRDGPYEVYALPYNDLSVQVCTLGEKVPLASGGVFGYERFVLVSDDVFGSPERSAISGKPGAKRYIAYEEGAYNRTVYWSGAEEVRFYNKAQDTCGFNSANTARFMAKTRADNIRIVLCAKALYEAQHGQASAQAREQPKPTPQPRLCTVQSCTLDASATCDGRPMCDVHAKQFDAWAAHQRGQIEQATADLDRPVVKGSQYLGSADVLGNPWNR